MLAIVALVTTASIATAYVALVATGHRVLVVRSDSMNPALDTGDLVVTRVVSPARVEPGDIVTFRDPTRDQALVTHRVRTVDAADGFFAVETRGDANDASEHWRIDADGTVGVLWFSIPDVGTLILGVSPAVARAALLWLAILTLAGAGLQRIWRPGARSAGPEYPPRGDPARTVTVPTAGSGAANSA